MIEHVNHYDIHHHRNIFIITRKEKQEVSKAEVRKIKKNSQWDEHYLVLLTKNQALDNI
jgi:hypothetical protein